jgi:PAS domain S-box-containing protein
VSDLLQSQLRLVRTLRGFTTVFGRFDEPEFNEEEFERHLEGKPSRAIAMLLYWIRKLQARALSGEYAAALSAASRAERLLWMSPAIFEHAEYHFWTALALAATGAEAGAEESIRREEAVAAHRRRLDDWARHCPEHFESRATLIGAEIARLHRDDLEAQRLYEHAISSARNNGLVHDEALANELAARFYAARGFEKIARVYLKDAHHCYARWGAAGKVRQLQELAPDHYEDERSLGATGTTGAPLEHLDLATVVKVSQAVAGEVEFEKLIDTVLRTAMAQAGADRGLLLLPRAGETRIAAAATTLGDRADLELRDDPVTASMLPESILNYVLRTREGVILEDALADSSFSADPYIRQNQPRSVLCLPLINQAKLIGVIYLENTLASRVFVPARTAVLKLVASQAAIALENSHLYRDLAEREARIRRLLDANIIGIFFQDSEGRITEANEAFLRLLRCDREEIFEKRLRLDEITPPDWRARDAQAATEMKGTGRIQPYEKEYVRKDGSRVPVLVGAASFDDGGNQGVAFVLDLSERKRAEHALNVAQAELSHVSRLTTMGELTASIAHEVKQPLTGIVSSGHASLRYLDADPHDIRSARRAVERIIKDAFRASDVIDRIRAMVKKSPETKKTLNPNEVILETLGLVSTELQRSNVLVRTELSNDIPLVLADQVQLQQVVLNLVINAKDAMTTVEEGPRELWIGTEAIPPDQILVSVRDSGPALDRAKIEDMFKAFHTTKAKGMGLGLTISRSIIEAHGGRLWAMPNEPHGAVLQFTLPVSRQVQEVEVQDFAVST